MLDITQEQIEHLKAELNSNASKYSMEFPEKVLDNEGLSILFLCSLTHDTIFAKIEVLDALMNCKTIEDFRSSILKNTDPLQEELMRLMREEPETYLKFLDILKEHLESKQES